MKKITFLILSLSFSYVMAEEPVCHKCQIIREYNRTHKETDFIYYEDYLKDKQEKAAAGKSNSAKEDEEASKKELLF